jgi:protocatechuate 3,4-dioxygenase beta subunit
MTPEGCKPLPGAMLDLWHCDAAGAYSDVRGGGGPGRGGDTEGKKFLRGYQITDENGAATFTTIYPGWYPGRAVHIHFKVRSAPDASARFEFTSQLFFDDKLSDRVHAKAPYAEHGQRDQRNKDDDIYFDGGFALVLDVKEDGDGYAASFDVALHTEQDKKPAA